MKTNRRNRGVFDKSIRAISIIFISMLFIGQVGMVIFSSDANSSFSDVNPSKWSAKHIEFVNENNYMTGVGSGLFSPKAIVTKAMTAQILYKLANTPEVDTSSNQFTDISSSKWYYKAVCWAKENRIMDGKDDFSFDPEASVTRAEFCNALFEYAVKNKMTFSFARAEDHAYHPADFKDLNSIPYFAQTAVRTFDWSNIVRGKTGNYFDGDSYITREEAATIIHMFSKNTVEPSENNILERNRLKAEVDITLNKPMLVSGTPHNRPGRVLTVKVRNAEGGDVPQVKIEAVVVNRINFVPTVELEKGDYGYVFPWYELEEDLAFVEGETAVVKLTFTIGEESESLTYYPTVKEYNGPI